MNTDVMNNALGTRKYVIACPNCHSYTEASKGFLGIFGATRKVNCGGCGIQYNINEAKMSTKECSHCGNTVIFDQTEGEKAVCPVCHEPINTRESIGSRTKISCPTCACNHFVDKGAEQLICPLCDTVIDVQREIFKKAEKESGVASLIKFEGGNDVFVWKHPVEDFNLGSQLIVHESQEAIFFKDGKALDLFGAGRYTLATQNLPLLDELYKLPFGGDSVFHSEIYFVNMTTQMGLKWGTDSKIRLFDPASGIPIEIGASGSFNLKVSDSRRLLLQVIGTESMMTQADIFADGDSYSINSMLGKFRSLIISKVKAFFARTIKEENINILEIDSYIDVLSERLRPLINDELSKYGLCMPEFYITNIVTPDDDPNFRRLKEQFAEKTLTIRQEEIRIAEARAVRDRREVEAMTEIVGAQGEAEITRIKAMAEADAYRAKALAEADEMRAKGYTYQQETARQVGMEAMKNGLSGGAGGNAGGIGDIAGLGMTLGAMGGIMNLTQDALNPIFNQSANLGQGISNTIAPSGNLWDCPNCNERNIEHNFCPNCGTKRPEPKKKDSWECPNCGEKDITFKFCPECGAKRPEPKKDDTWNCPNCGEKDITFKFCPECGAKRPEQKNDDTWDCPNCGEKDITFKFCPECGAKRPEPKKDDTWDCPNCGEKGITFKFCPECGCKKSESEQDVDKEVKSDDED